MATTVEPGHHIPEYLLPQGHPPDCGALVPTVARSSGAGQQKNHRNGGEREGAISDAALSQGD